MPYGVVTSLSAPIEVYDQIHTQVIGNAATAIEGLLLHIGRPSPAGFEVVEVWESRATLRPIPTRTDGLHHGQPGRWYASFDAGPDNRGV